ALAGGGVPDGVDRLPRVQEGHDQARARRAGADSRTARDAERGGRAHGARRRQRARAPGRRRDDGRGARGGGHAMSVAPCTVKLDVFEGPLDLLLHLIKKNEVQITDIPIATTTDQYLAVLEELPELNLDGAGEYLVMAAALMYIKSRLLLPADPDDEADAEIDPRAELVQQLLEYQRYREAAADLGARRILERDVFASPGEPDLTDDPADDRPRV